MRPSVAFSRSIGVAILGIVENMSGLFCLTVIPRFRSLAREEDGSPNGCAIPWPCSMESLMEAGCRTKLPGALA